MRRVLAGAAGLLCLGIATPAASQPHPAVAAALQAHCQARQATPTLRARFVQTRIFETLAEADTAAGVLYYRRPDAVRWQYAEPETSWTVLNGDQGWSVFPRLRQVHKFDLQRAQTEAVLSIVGFGACGKDLQQTFAITLEPSEERTQVLRMTPLESEIAARFTHIDLVLDTQDHLPRQVVLHETSGNTMRFEFLDVERGVRIADALFEYEFPKGYEILE